MTPAQPEPLNLEAYLSRICYKGERSPSHAVLEALHLSHATHIPFENLDLLLGRPIRLDLASLQAKLVQARRGGYCFEQNSLFAAVLEAMGFHVTLLAARVRFRVDKLLPRTHVLCAVEADGQRWLADVGFGTVGPLMPIPLVSDCPVRQFAWTYRVIDLSPEPWVLQRQLGGDWEDLYAFTFEPQFPIDIEVANWYVSTHPESRFVQALIAQRSTPQTRYLLRNYDYTEDDGAETRTRTLAGDSELLEILAKQFRLLFPSGTRFNIRCATDPWAPSRPGRLGSPDG